MSFEFTFNNTTDVTVVKWLFELGCQGFGRILRMGVVGRGCCGDGDVACRGGPRPLAARLPSPRPSPAERERGRLSRVMLLLRLRGVEIPRCARNDRGRVGNDLDRDWGMTWIAVGRVHGSRLGVYVDRDWESTWIAIGMTWIGIGILAICSVAADYLEY